MSFIAFDQSKSSTGWAAWQHGWEKPVYGHKMLGSAMTKEGQTFTKLRELIIECYSVVTPFDHLFFEESIAHKAGTQTSESNVLLLTGLRTVLLGVGYELRCSQVLEIPQDTWRPEYIGRIENDAAKAAARRLSKATDKKVSARSDLKWLTMERCRQLGLKPRCDDEGDAIGILTCGMLKYGFTPPWLADEVLRPMFAERAR